MVSHVLDIVFNGEPLILVLFKEVHTVRQLNLHINKVRSLNIDEVSNLVVLNAEERSGEQIVSGLRTTSRQAHCLHSFIVIKQASSRSYDNFSLTRLGNDIDCVASPYINCHNTLILGVKSDSARLSVGNATADICIGFKNSQSVELVGSAICTVDSIGYSISHTLTSHLLSNLLAQSAVVLQNFHVARVEQSTLLSSQLTLNHNFLARVREIHLRTLDGLNLASQSVKNVATFALRDCNGMMHILAIILNHCVFRTRIVNHLLLASDEQLFTSRMLSTVFILICSDNLNVDTADRRKLQCAEDRAALRTLYESLSRLREHHGRTMDISLLTIFVLEDCILQTLQSNGLAHKAHSVIVIDSNYLDTSRRYIERNFSTLDNEQLTHEVLFALLGNFLTFGINDSCTCNILHSSLCVVYTSKQVLVRTKSVTTNNLSHLARIQSERYRTRNVYLSTNFHRLRNCVCLTRLRILTICARVLEDYIPALRSRHEQLSCLLEILSFLKLLGLGIESYQCLLLANSHSQRTYVGLNGAIGLILQEAEFVDRKYQVSLLTAHRSAAIVLFIISSHHLLLLYLLLCVAGVTVTSLFQLSDESCVRCDSCFESSSLRN